MKSFAIAAIIATVSAEAAYKCVKADGWTEDPDTAKGVAEADDDTKCEDACKAIATADKENDYCCAATTTIDTKVIACTLWKAETGKDSIKKASADTDKETSMAWAWTASKLNDDIGTGDDADSATMISSAIATIAAIAMVAY